MDRTAIFIAALVAPLMIQATACSGTDPMTQKSGGGASKDCATEARRMQEAIREAPQGRRRTSEDMAEAALYADEALRQANAGDEAACRRELGKAQGILP